MKLLCGDMLGQLSKVEDLSVDLLLTDPPYNISNKAAHPNWIDPKTGENKNRIHDQKFDNKFDEKWDSVTHDEFKELLTVWANAWYPKLRKGASFAVFISDRYISYLWTAVENAGFEPKRIITWKKPAAVPFNRKVNPVSGCEYILFGIKPGGKRTFNSDAVKGSLVERFSLADKISSILYKHIKNSESGDLTECFNNALTEAIKVQSNLKSTGDIVHCVIPNTISYSGGLGKDKIHPTQKPTEILQYFIELCSNPGDVVLDPFAGSGSTGVAALNTGRQYVLIEQDKKMFHLMEKRLETTYKVWNSLFE
jgi:site-specific DNA-methyltransferase (adenine-specific)